MPRRLLFVCLIAGWVLPAALAAHECLAWCTGELLPRLSSTRPMDSFPHLRLCGQAITATLAWLGVALAVVAGRSTRPL